MSEKSEILDALTEFVKRKAIVNDSLVCTVTSIDTIEYTCYCEPIDDYADVQQVKVAIQKDKLGFVLVPKLNSLVVVSFLSDESGYIDAVTEIDKVIITIDSSNKLEVSSSGFVFNDGTLNGIPKVDPLVTKLNNLENDLNNFKSIMNTLLGTPIPEPGNGANSAFQAAMALAMSTYDGATLTPTVKADLENTKIKQ